MIRSNSCARLAIACLAGAAMFAPLAHAATFNFEDLQFTSPAFAVGSGSVSISGTSGPINYAATFLQDVDTLRFTNVSIVCQAEGGQCTNFDMAFEADGGVGSGFLGLNLAIDGNLDGATGFGRVCISQSGTICAADLTGTQSDTLAFVNGVPLASPGVVYPLFGGFSILGVFHLDSLPQDSTGLSLPNSFDINLSPAFGSVPTPEPGTALLMGIGVIALSLSRKILRNRKS
jgi:hypothetical protein